MFYAQYSPRGFSNEFDLIAFPTKTLRDKFVSAVPRTRWSGYYNAWVEQEPNARAYSVTAKEVAKVTRGDRNNYDGTFLSVPNLFGRGERNGCFYSYHDNLDSDGYQIDPSNTVGE